MGLLHQFFHGFDAVSFLPSDSFMVGNVKNVSFFFLSSNVFLVMKKFLFDF